MINQAMRQIRLGMGLFLCAVSAGPAADYGRAMALGEAAAASPPPVISIGSIVNVANAWPIGDYSLLALRLQLVTDLIAQYQCVVVSRTQSYDLALEQAVEAVSTAESIRASHEEMVAADYFVAGHFSDGEPPAGYAGYVFSVKLDEADDEAVSSAPFKAASREAIGASMVEAVAGLLNLVPKDASRRHAIPDLRDVPMTWTVMPFLRMDEEDVRSDEALAMLAEQALPVGENGWSLVDRSRLREVLREHDLSMCAGVSPWQVSRIGRLVRADRMLMGTVSSFRDGWRLDVHLVDPISTVVLNARSATGSTAEELHHRASEMAAALFRESSPFAPFRSATRSDRRRDAEMFLSSRFNPERTVWSWNTQLGSWGGRVMNAEAAYLLTHDDPEMVYRVAVALSGGLRQGTFQYPAITKRAARFVDEILNSRNYDSRGRIPLIIRADALLTLDDPEGALQLLREHERKNPGVEPARRLLSEGWCHLAIGNPDQAWECVQKAIRLGYRNYHTTELERAVMGQTADMKLDRRKEYDRLDSYIHSASYVNEEQMKRFLDLACEFHSNKKMLHLVEDLQARRLGGGLNYILAAAKVKYMVQLGRIREAGVLARLCLNSCEKQIIWGMTPELRSYFQSFVENYEHSFGPVVLDWLPASAVRKLPDHYAVYLVPVGEIDIVLVNEAAKRLSDHLGGRVQVLTSIPLPERSKPSMKDREQNAYTLKTRELLDGLLKESQIPGDALQVVYVTAEKFLNRPTWEHCVTDVASPNYYDPDAPENPIIVSCYGYSETKVIWKGTVESIAWKAASMLRKEHHKEGNSLRGPKYSICPNYPCMHYGRPENSGMTGLVFLMCPDCQEEYRNASLESVHRRLHDYLKKNQQNP